MRLAFRGAMSLVLALQPWNVISTPSHDAWSLIYQPCPATCTSESKTSSWSSYRNVDILKRCNESMLLDFSIHNAFDDPESPVIVHACSVSSSGFYKDPTQQEDSQAKFSEEEVSLEIAWWYDDDFSSQGTDAALYQMKEVLMQSANNATQNLFTYSGTSLVGAFAGSSVHHTDIANNALKVLGDYVVAQPSASRIILQYCGMNSKRSLGLIVDQTGDFSAVQEVMGQWNEATCLEKFNGKADIPKSKLRLKSLPTRNSTTQNSKPSSRSQRRGTCQTIQVASGDSCATLTTKCGIPPADFLNYNPSSTLCSSLIPGQHVCCSAGGLPEEIDGEADLPKPKLRSKSLSARDATTQNSKPSTRSQRRGTCRTIQVASGDSCGSLATECGISPASFTNYNPSSTLCSSLIPGQHVCCSAGGLPDFVPKPQPDGTCATYLVQSGDTCSGLAASNAITNDEIEKFNKNTWGWTGCAILQAQELICLSSGDPPMPAAVQNAVCGPQVAGTEKPTNGTSLADLNPCPLNACCDVWGQCGITLDFCTATNSSTGAPGTSAAGTNGCISNCGTDIVNNATAPDAFISIGYFEAFDQDRECLNMDVTEFDTAVYTHLHFAFAAITDDYNVDVSKIQGQFEKLKVMGSIRRILSFGGWSFSTDQDSFPIFRQGVTDANRELFASNAAQFIQEHDLDGIDFDWEYPGAPDIPGIPPGDPGDGDRYLEFLKLVRQNLPESKTVSIAAPASFWYLKGFPIKEIAGVVDYIVYMTYDLHGQWDYGNEWPDPGCPSGACLRSHVNLTETTSALSMITKAGVPSKKVVVGLSSYGRSFQMVKAGCIGPMCQYTGPKSGATPGRCTKTAGYIANAEINEIIASNDSAEKSFDSGSDSNILVYNNTQWVAYLDETTKSTRTEYYESLNMGGTTDWAVDLQSFQSDSSGYNDPFANEQIFYVDPSVWTEENPSMNCEAPCVLVLPDLPLPTGTVITRTYTTTLDVAWVTVSDVTETNGDVAPITTVTHILQETAITATPVTISNLPLANVNITLPLSSDEKITFTPKARLPAQTLTITDDPNPLNETGVTHAPVTRTVTLPPWPEISVLYLPGDNQNYEENLPKIPKATITRGPGGPGPCKTGCGGLCTGIFCPWGGGIDNGGGSEPGRSNDPDFPDPIDPNPPPNPNDPDEDGENDGDNESSTSSCMESTVTDFWVSCITEGPSSTSCTTTSKMVAIGCDVTAMTQTTGVAVCYSVDADADQGEDGVPRTFSPSTVTSPAVKTTTAGAGGGGESTSTKTTTNTAPSGPRASSIGQFDIAAFWETIIDPFPSKITGYYLNWIPATQTKIDPCGTAYLQDFGGVSPTSTTWSAMPNSISFDATYRVGDGTYSDCFYTNPAAPSSAGDGGTVSCRGGEVPCTTFNKWDVASCDGLDSETRVLPMIGCPITEVATMTT